MTNKIRLLVEAQERYEDKINKLETQLALLERQGQLFENKSKFTLNIGISEPQSHSTVNLLTPSKPKNLSELRALHLKLKSQD